jgi:hypothetical protein
MPIRKNDFERALRDPKSVYDTPEQVLADPRLDRQGKRSILETWKQDAEALLRAEGEAMTHGEPNMLRRVDLALRTLDVGNGEEKRRSRATGLLGRVRRGGQC